MNTFYEQVINEAREEVMASYSPAPPSTEQVALQMMCEEINDLKERVDQQAAEYKAQHERDNVQARLDAAQSRKDAYIIGILTSILGAVIGSLVTLAFQILLG